MWFGLHITAIWWDDLWLTESISCLLSFICISCLADQHKDSNDTVIHLYYLEKFGIYKIK